MPFRMPIRKTVQAGDSGWRFKQWLQAAGAVSTVSHQWAGTKQIAIHGKTVCSELDPLANPGPLAESELVLLLKTGSSRDRDGW
jgi:hypothetical protein